MELPHTLRQAVDEALDGVALADLRRASELLTLRYRGEVRDGRTHLHDEMSARAYLGARLPATYAAVRASVAAVAALRPDFSPRSVLDAGAGPGTAVWAARDCWPSVTDATLIESSPAIREFGERMLAHAQLEHARWAPHDLARLPPQTEKRDLVMLAYVLDELNPSDTAPLIDTLWDATGDMFVAIEPGTPAGWTRIMAVRAQLIASGAHIVAPCPHARTCPLAPPDWCHFSRRVARARMHRLIKSADVPWEDEPFIYVAASRHPGLPALARVIAPPRLSSGTVSLKLCERDGQCARRVLSRRDGASYKAARRLGWGDAIMPADSDASERRHCPDASSARLEEATTPAPKKPKKR